MIEIQAVSKRYDNGFLALENINLSIPRGEIYGVLGKSGAGKSTLLRCVNLLERPTTGKIFIDNVDLTKLSARELRNQRHHIGIIFQHYNLLQSCNVFENIALPLKILNLSDVEIQTKVSALLKLVHLEDKAHYHPSQLSGGQKQRVGIARALAAEPKVLLCDEATSALDTESTASILRLLKQINRELNLTIFMITHELEVVKQICDKVGVIHEGRLVEQNSTVNIFSNPKHDVTKQVIQQALHFYKPSSHDSQSLFLKFTFIGHDSEEPLISNLIKKFDVTINIKQALIEKIQATTVGFTICELKGTEDAIKNALDYVKSTSVNVEVLHA